MVRVVKSTLGRSLVLGALALLLAVAAGTGCQRMEKFGKHWESGMEGLDRTITLYDDHGGLIGRWNAKTYIETRKGTNIVAFLDSAGHEVKLSGGIVVSEER